MNTQMWPIKELEEKDAEIERLKGQLDAAEHHNGILKSTNEAHCVVIEEDHKLITQLADALERYNGPKGSVLYTKEKTDLIQRARQAVV